MHGGDTTHHQRCREVVGHMVPLVWLMVDALHCGREGAMGQAVLLEQ